jgi:hypothetical protein
MAKTFTNIAAFTAGQTLTAANMNSIGTTLNANTVPPMCVVGRRATLQAIATATNTYVTWDTQDVNTEGALMFTASSDTITIQTPGIYAVALNVYFAAGAGTLRVIGVAKNPTSASDTTYQVAGSYGPNNTTYGLPLSCIGYASLAAGDTIKAHVYQDSGGSLNIGTVSQIMTNLSVVWVGNAS